jgi:hypothetical protein
MERLRNPGTPYPHSASAPCGLRAIPPSHHPVLRIVDPPVKAASPGLAVERHGEVAERVGGVRAPVAPRCGRRIVQDYMPRYNWNLWKTASAP